MDNWHHKIEYPCFFLNLTKLTYIQQQWPTFRSQIQLQSVQNSINQAATSVRVPGKTRPPPTALAAFELDDGVALSVLDAVGLAVALPLVVEVGLGAVVSFSGDMTLSKTWMRPLFVLHRCQNTSLKLLHCQNLQNVRTNDLGIIEINVVSLDGH